MKQQELNLILEDHKKWLLGEGGSCADLSDANLRHADLSRANLSGANLRHADLGGANLRHANLSGANLSRADLSGANLRHADLGGANLSGANLSRANLSGANLRHADLSGANLSRANLSGANLSRADLSRANLRHAGYKCDGRFHHITNIGSESGVLEMYSCGDKGWLIKRGCFSGSKQKFLDAVTETHGDNDHAKKYRSIIELFCGENDE